VRPNKPWFGPIPSIGKAACPISWEGYAVTVAFVVGLALLRLESDVIRRAIALALVIAAYTAIVILTWGDPEGAVVRRGWRETFWNRYTLVWLAVLLLLAGALIAAGFVGCGGCYHRPAPWGQLH